MPGFSATFRVLIVRALLLLVVTSHAIAQVSEGFEHFFNLEYDQAIAIFRQALIKDPANASFHNHLAQAILYREMFLGGALESELVSGTNAFITRERLSETAEAAREFEQLVNKAMSLAQAKVDADPSDWQSLYALGVSYGLRANSKFLVRKAWRDSLKDATRARELHNKVVMLQPNFIDARLVQGLHDYVVGSLPWHWKVLGFLTGYSGNREEGIKTLRMVAEKGKQNQYDAQVILAVIYRREKQPEKAIPLLSNLLARFPRNYLFRLETVQMYSDAGDKPQALGTLEKIEALKKSNAPGFASLPVEKIYYYRGNLLFWYDDLDQALDQLRRATSRAKQLDEHTAVMAWMRLGQVNDMKGRRKEAVSAYQQAILVAPDSDVAKESKQYINSRYKRG